MKTKMLLLTGCLFCATTLSAQNNTFLQKWETKVKLQRSGIWDNYTRTATAPQNQTVYALYLSGKNVATFRSIGECQSEKNQLKSIANTMLTTSKPSSSTGSGSSGGAMSELERMAAGSGVDVVGMKGNIRNAVNKSVAEAEAKNKRESLSSVESQCSCRSESNPNYDPNAKSNDLGYSGLFPPTDNNKTGGNQSGSTFADNQQTQYDNIFEAPSARTPQQPTAGATPGVNLNFEGLSQHTNTGGGIYVGDGNWTAPIVPEQSIKLDGLDTKNIEEYRKWIEKIKSQPFDVEVLQYRKKLLESKYEETMIDCNKFSEFDDCQIKLKPISDAIKLIDKEIVGRKEWLESLPKDKEELAKLEKEYQKLAEMAQIAECAYHKNEFPEGWNEIKDKNLTQLINNINTIGYTTGFECVVLQKDDNYVISFRGTDGLDNIFSIDGYTEANLDIIYGWSGYLSSDAAQTNMTINITKEIVAELKRQGIDSDKITTTGHSLGGHLAAEAALNCGLTAYTFNSMDISMTSKIKIAEKSEIEKGITIDASKIHNYVSPNDILNGTPVGFTNVGENAKGGVSNSTISYPNDKGKIVDAKIEYGNTEVIKEDYEGHSIKPLWQFLKQRHYDIEDKINSKE
jgi:hypothetical protein